MASKTFSLSSLPLRCDLTCYAELLVSQVGDFTMIVAFVLRTLKYAQSCGVANWVQNEQQLDNSQVLLNASHPKICLEF